MLSRMHAGKTCGVAMQKQQACSVTACGSSTAGSACYACRHAGRSRVKMVGVNWSTMLRHVIKRDFFNAAGALVACEVCLPACRTTCMICCMLTCDMSPATRTHVQHAHSNVWHGNSSVFAWLCAQLTPAGRSSWACCVSPFLALSSSGHCGTTSHGCEYLAQQYCKWL